jgi:hypothetical protein
MNGLYFFVVIWCLTVVIGCLAITGLMVKLLSGEALERINKENE